jgi:beta-lactam-binding protein with PASTA domain
MTLKEFILSKQFIKNLSMAAVILVAVLILTLVWLNFYTRHGQARAVPDFIGLNMEQTINLAKKSKLKYQIADSVYTTAVPRGCVAEQNPKPGFKVKKWRNIMLTLNAFNPEMTAMPNLVDLPKRQALAVIESAGLETGILRYVADISIDVVLQQLYNGKDIAEGDSLQKGSVIDLVLGKGLSNQRTSVPNLTGTNLSSATDMILGASLNLGTYIYDNTILTADDTANAFVYKQNPEYNPDATLQLGSAIYLWLTVDSSKMTVYPDSLVIDSTEIPDQTPEQLN